MATFSVIQGDSSPVYLITISGYTDISAAGWTGKVMLSATLGGALTVNRAMDKAADSSGFLGYLTPTETTGLTVGNTYQLTFQVTNTSITPQINRELQNTITVLAQAG